jgi:hypothetical protein
MRIVSTWILGGGAMSHNSKRSTRRNEAPNAAQANRARYPGQAQIVEPERKLTSALRLCAYCALGEVV